jgi:hypothetical protein
MTVERDRRYVNLGILQAATLQTQTAVEACLHEHH